MTRRRVFLVEDHPVFRRGLREIIAQEEDLEVCGEADTVTKASCAIARDQPDLVIVDICLQERSGLELIKELRERHPKLVVLVVSMYDESLYAERALTAGALGYVMKQEAPESIVRAARSVLEGRPYLSQKLTAALIGRFVGAGTPQGPAPEASPHERLTSRELEVLQMIGQGLTTGEIAGRLAISVKTVGTHREKLKEKLNLKTASELNRYATLWHNAGGARPKADPSDR
ncbi:MAG: response regulator transcription factor [Deferrisomatales bacterium]|nr:response regulator transcription factor [Deferrisomatales bacterium]